MIASDIEKVLEKIAPRSLAYEGEELGFLVGDENKEVRVVGVTERPTIRVLEEAIIKQVDMLVIHEPLYQSKKVSIVDPSLLQLPPNKKKGELVAKGKFCVYRFHSQWDDAKEGNNETLAELLNITVTEKLPYGRLGSIGRTTLRQLIAHVKQKLGCERVLVVGEDKRVIKTVAVVAGSGNALIDVMELVKIKGADVLVSGDIQDSRARFAAEVTTQQPF